MHPPFPSSLLPSLTMDPFVSLVFLVPWFPISYTPKVLTWQYLIICSGKLWCVIVIKRLSRGWKKYIHLQVFSEP